MQTKTSVGNPVVFHPNKIKRKKQTIKQKQEKKLPNPAFAKRNYFQVSSLQLVQLAYENGLLMQPISND